MTQQQKVKDIIDNNIAYLVDNIEVKTNVFWEKLIGFGLFTSPDVTNIKVIISLIAESLAITMT